MSHVMIDGKGSFVTLLRIKISAPAAMSSLTTSSLPGVRGIVKGGQRQSRLELHQLPLRDGEGCCRSEERG